MLRVLTLATLFPTGERPTFGGFVERQCRALAAQPDVEVRVVSPVGVPLWPLSLHPLYGDSRGLPAQEDLGGLIVYRPRFATLPGVGQPGTARRLAAATLDLLREIRREFPFDVVDAEYFWPDGVAARHLARALGLPFSIKARGSDIDHWGHVPAIGTQMVDAARHADGLLAVSAALRQRMIGLGMPEAIHVHYTGVDLDLFRPGDKAAAKAALGVSGPLIASVGALIPLKGHRVAIAAMRELPEATLLIAGEGPERAALERQAAEYGNRVRLLGTLPHHELPALLGAADAMVLASEREGLANVWVEALACGTPLVISDAGGAREVVDRAEAGLIVARDPAAVAAALRRLIDRQFDPAAVRRAAERFSWARNGAELARHLRAISGERHQGSDDPSFLAA
jgi:glycosyltransferase involved in cell wall biosynthesis